MTQPATQLTNFQRSVPTANRARPLTPISCGTSLELDPIFSSLLTRRWVVMALLAMIGPLGLPALWLSPRFSRTSKIVTSVVFFLLTVVAPLAMTYYWLAIALQPLVEAFQHAKP